MWISEKEYKKLKQEAGQSKQYRRLSLDYASEANKYRNLYTILKNQLLKLYSVEVYLKCFKPITYYVKALTEDEAEQAAIKLFKDKNKDFSASDIVMITVKPMNCAM